MGGNELNSTGYEMKALLATIALLCLSSTGLAHDMYSNLRDRAGHLLQATVLPNGSYYLPETGETIPADMASPSPDDRFHHCLMQFDSWGGPLFESTPTTGCFFAPMHSS
jgi:hypothetical protein